MGRKTEESKVEKRDFACKQVLSALSVFHNIHDIAERGVLSHFRMRMRTLRYADT